MTNTQPSGHLLHACVTVSSAARARQVFSDLFGLPLVKKFEVGADLCATLFGFAGEATVHVYDAGPAAIEVFVCHEKPQPRGSYDHVCLDLADLAAVLESAAAQGMEVRRFRKEDKDVVILRDKDGNLYELKQRV